MKQPTIAQLSWFFAQSETCREMLLQETAIVVDREMLRQWTVKRLDRNSPRREP
jgi:hypothetical protein